jgi:hypothetical protein
LVILYCGTTVYSVNIFTGSYELLFEGSSNPSDVFYDMEISPDLSEIAFVGNFAFNVSDTVQYTNAGRWNLKQSQFYPITLSFTEEAECDSVTYVANYTGGTFLYVGGIFTFPANGAVVSNIVGCTFDGTCNENLGGGAQDRVTGVEEIENSIYILVSPLAEEYSQLFVYNANEPHVAPSLLSETVVNIGKSFVSVPVTPPVVSTPIYETWWFISSLVTVVCLLIFILVAVRIYIRRKYKRDYILIPDVEETINLKQLVQVLQSDEEICKLAESELTFISPIGEGGQATVWKAFYKEKFVAAKSIFFDDPTSLTDFRKEIKFLSALQHENIVKCLGIVIAADKIWLITELMDSNLESILKILKPHQKRKAGVEIARAM